MSVPRGDHGSLELCVVGYKLTSKSSFSPPLNKCLVYIPVPLHFIIVRFLKQTHYFVLGPQLIQNAICTNCGMLYVASAAS